MKTNRTINKLSVGVNKNQVLYRKIQYESEVSADLSHPLRQFSGLKMRPLEGQLALKRPHLGPSWSILTQVKPP